MRLRLLRAGLEVTLCAMLLVGCAGVREYNQGNELLAAGRKEEALKRFEEAIKADPRNAKYRIALATQRAALLNELNGSGEQLRRQGRLTEAEKAYRQALGVDPGNEAARGGMEAIAAERKHRQILQQAEALEKSEDGRQLEEAAALLRGVLAENPQQREARALQQKILDKQAKLAKPAEQRLAAAFRKPITLEFRDAPLRSIFDVIARVSGLNFFFDKDVRTDGKATILARDTSIEDAVRILLTTNQLEQKILNEKSVLIYPANPQKQREYQALSVRSFYLANADVKSVTNTLRTLLKTRDIVTDERLGLIMMRDTPEAIRLAERIIALQDMADSEVMLEVEVLEVKRTRLLELGLKWPQQATLSVVGTADNPLTPDSLHARRVGVTVDPAVITARKDDTDSNILANPRIRVRNKDKARVVIGDRVPVITTTSTSTGFVSESVSYLDVGLKLEVEPTISLDDEVAIKVSLEVSNLVREVLSRTGSLSYQVGTRNAATVLRLKDGETQTLAGLINQEDRASSSKLPGFGDFPILGRLFGGHKDDTQSTEIVLSITPRILRAVRRPDLVAAEFETGTEASLGSRALSVSTSEAPRAQAPAASPASAAQRASSTGLPPAAQQAGGSTSGQPPSTSSSPSTATPPVGRASPAAPSSTGSTSPGPAPGAAPPPGQRFFWQGPQEVKAGEQFSLVLRIQSDSLVRSMPLMLSYDVATLQVTEVLEGDFLKRGSAQTTFSNRIDPVQGRVHIATVRSSNAGQDPGVNGDGTLVTVVFRAVRSSDLSRIQLLSATPDPAPPLPAALPVDFSLTVRQP
jgi:general secretion pathway protein D